MTSTFVPPSPELNLTLAPPDLSQQVATVAHRIADFDNIFKNLINLRAQKAAASAEELKKQRTVSFNPVANVILIPSCQEYHDAELAELLWWTRKELKSFQLEAKREIRQLMRYAMYTRSMGRTGFSLGSPMAICQQDDSFVSYSSSTETESVQSHTLLEDCS